MTTEEIEKAFSNHIANYEKMIGQPIKHRQDALHHFTQGMSVSDKHWQEKTRWIPVEEKLPIPLPFEDVGVIANGDLLLLKHIGYGSIEFGVLRELNNKKYFELPDCGNCEINEISHWKEIE